MLLTHFSDLELKRIYDGTLQRFIQMRQTECVGAITIDRSLEVMCTNRAARAYRDDDGRPWLERVPPQISMLAESLVRRARLRGNSS